MIYYATNEQMWTRGADGLFSTVRSWIKGGCFWCDAPILIGVVREAAAEFGSLSPFQTLIDRARMSGNGAKKVAEVAIKASKSIDWDGMAKLLVSDEARKEFTNLRRAFDDVNHQLQTKFSLVRIHLTRWQI